MMSKINQTDIDRLIELVGGRGNIATVSHCITRLRFVLNQPANARPKEIEQLPMVKGCFTNAGQFQVVIGTNVGDYYQALVIAPRPNVGARLATVGPCQTRAWLSTASIPSARENFCVK